MRCETRGDGACAIHAVFGNDSPAGGYFCPQARELICHAMGNEWTDLTSSGVDVSLVQELRDLLWNDFVYRAVSNSGSLTLEGRIVWSEICKSVALKDACTIAVEREMSQNRRFDEVRKELVNVFASLCVPACEDSILKPLLAHVNLLQEFSTAIEGRTKLEIMYENTEHAAKLRRAVE